MATDDDRRTFKRPLEARSLMSCDHWLPKMKRPCRFKVAIRATWRPAGRRRYVTEYCALHRGDAAGADLTERVGGEAAQRIRQQ